MSNTKASNNSKRILEQTRDQQLAHMFSDLGGDTSGYIRRNKGRLLVNIGCPIISRIVAKVLCKHFRSSVQKLTYEVFKRLCVEAFKTPLTDGFSAWYRLCKLHQTELTLSDAQASCGVEISFDASEDETGIREVESTVSESSMAAMAPPGSVKKNREQKKREDGPSVYSRLCEKNTEKEKLLEEMRRQQLQAEIEECYFYPQTSRKNKASPPRRRPSNFYDRLLEKEKQKEGFLEEARRKKAAHAMQECTFRPILNRTRSPASNRSSAYPSSSRLDGSDYLSSTLDLGSSFVADPVPLSLYSPATTAVSSPLAVELPVRFSNRDLQFSGREQEKASASEQPNQFVIGGGRRSLMANGK